VMQVSIAVLPLELRIANPESDAIGDLISDGVISELSKVAQLRVISRLSSAALRNRKLTPQEIGSVLGSKYVLSGSYFIHNQKVVVTVELTIAKDGKVIWSERLTKEIADLLEAQSELIGSLAYQVHTQIVQTEFQLSTTHPLPTVQSYSLLLSAITLMHRMSKRDFAWSQKILHELISRHPRNPTPRAWLAKWHNLAIAQGWSPDVNRDAALTHSIINSALDINPKDSLALTIRALALGYVDKKFDEARQAYQEALLINPNESLAWIGTATLNTWLGNEEVAVDAAQKALLLSPLDPLKYYFYGMAAAAMLVGNRLSESIELAKKSIRLNSGLSATRRVLVITYALNNQIDMAKQTAIELQQIDPDFTIQKFKSTSPLYRSPNGEIYANALRAAEVKL
jgi:adenylate cyclase